MTDTKDPVVFTSNDLYVTMRELSQLMSDAQFPHDPKSLLAFAGLAMMAVFDTCGDRAVAEHILHELMDEIFGDLQRMPRPDTPSSIIH